MRLRVSITPVCCCDGQIVDVDFAALLLEVMEFIRRDTADDLAAVQCGNRDERITAG